MSNTKLEEINLQRQQDAMLGNTLPTGVFVTEGENAGKRDLADEEQSRSSKRRKMNDTIDLVPEMENGEGAIVEMERTSDQHRSKMGRLEEEYRALKDKQIELLGMVGKATSTLSGLEKNLAKAEKAKNAYCSQIRSKVSSSSACAKFNVTNTSFSILAKP